MASIKITIGERGGKTVSMLADVRAADESGERLRVVAFPAAGLKPSPWNPVGEISEAIDASLQGGGIGEVIVAPPGFWHLFGAVGQRATRRERRHLCPGTVVRERSGSYRRIGLVMARAYDEAGGCDFLTVRWWSAREPSGGATSLPASRASRFWRRAGAADRLRVRRAYGAPHTCRGAPASSACVLCGREVPEGSPHRWGLAQGVAEAAVGKLAALFARLAANPPRLRFDLRKPEAP